MGIFGKGLIIDLKFRRYAALYLVRGGGQEDR